MDEKLKELGLDRETVLDMYYYMLLARRLDERTWLLNRAGKIPFVVSCQGQEAAQVAAAFALQKNKDYFSPYYRDTALVLALGMTARDLLLFSFAKAEDPNSGGRQMPGHFGGRKYNILTQSSPVGTQIPQAAGVAMAAKIKGDDIVSFASLGEGSSSQGDFHEGLNFAGVHQLPLVCFCENNKYALSVPLKKQIAGEDIAGRAAAYGFPGEQVDGNDLLEVYRVTKEAVDRARAGNGPTLIEALMYRLVPHSSDDDDSSYRSREEVEAAKKKDPVIQFCQDLKTAGIMDEAKEKELEQQVADVVDEATEYAEKAPYPKTDDLEKYVYAE